MLTDINKSKIFNVFKTIIFFVGLAIIIFILNKVFMPKRFYNNAWPTTTTFVNFYDMQKDTVDVLFLGSSRAVSAFSPQQLYNEYGITSYNLSSEQQSMFVSYYWLKEALGYQQPKAVILDIKELFFLTEEPLNLADGSLRNAINYMKFSNNKIDAITEICAIDPGQKEISYYFPFQLFHSRWNELNENDFIFDKVYEGKEQRGYKGLRGQSGANYKPFNEGDSDEFEENLPVMEEYLDKIVALCKENNIELILVNIPFASGNIKSYNSSKKYADENGLRYYDFCLAEYYEKLGYKMAIDNNDMVHPNVLGAIKITNFVGDILINECNIAARSDEQYEVTRDINNDIMEDAKLCLESDFKTYLQMLKKDRYSIFMSVRDEASGISDDEAKLFEDLGLKCLVKDNFRISYLAAILDNQVIEEADYSVLRNQGGNDYLTYDISSAGFAYGNSSSIKINGTEYSKNGIGLNIVVYDNVNKMVLDSVCFNIYADGECTR